MGLLGLSSASVQAAYTVIDDDLYPTSMIEARNTGAKGVTEKFKVGFTKGSSVLTPIARAAVEGYLVKMQPGVTITITARIDNAAPTTNARQQGLALARGAAIRAYLVGEGVEAEAIRVEVDPAGNPQSGAGISVAEVAITTPAPVAAPARFAPQVAAAPQRAIPHQYRNLTAAEPDRTRAEPAIAEIAHRPSSDDRIIKYINSAVSSGQMSPAVAAQIIRALMEASGVAQPPAQVAAPLPTRWELKARMTLKENIDAWAEASGWKPTIWDSVSAFEVTANRWLDGGFPDVLRRIADSTGLNICANPRERTIRVTDAAVACNK
jgi:hypothetical protein